VKNIHELSLKCHSSRFPRAAALIDILALAELFRTTAAGLDALAESAWRHEPASLRRQAHGLVRELVVELQGQVGL
jgi:hypothetical protein